MNTKEMTRFDTRLSKDQKEYLEYAAKLGGYKTLSDFVLSSAKNKADQIVESHNQILTSVKDREVFYNAILHPQKPNARLKRAAGKYKKTVRKKS